MGKVALTVTR